jgi:membrane-bound inhibitor of C-type lysozyme
MYNSIIGVFALAMCASAGAASAEITISFPLEIDTADGVNSASYLCEDGESFSAHYVNAGVNLLALLTIDGEDRIFVNVMSASGARYVSGQYVWWTKGSSATLDNRLAEGSMKSCRLQEPAFPTQR